MGENDPVLVNMNERRKQEGGVRRRALPPSLRSAFGEGDDGNDDEADDDGVRAGDGKK